MRKYVVLSFLLFVSTVGCATLSSVPLTVRASCSYEQAWSVSLASVDEFELRQIDKEKGVIATEWMALTSKRKAGVLKRDANQERARFFLNLEQDPQTIEISIRQIREFFSPMGVQSQSTHWRRIPPIVEEEQRLAQRISNQLRDKGCATLS